MSIDVTLELLGDYLPVPRIMESTPRWLRWRPIERGDKVAKMPITLSGRPARVNDPGDWADYFDALWTRRGAGLGFVLGEGIGCIDLDGAIREDGSLTAWARRILDSAPRTFMEVSWSGRGLHIWGLLDEAPGRNLRSKGVTAEVYSQGRYIALGSTPWADSVQQLADITDLAKELTA